MWSNLRPGQELDRDFSGLQNAEGMIMVAGFGSLLSKDSALYTFPGLLNFRAGKIKGYRRIFAHTASVFFQRGIARLDTREISSLSCEEHNGDDIVVSVFEVPGTASAIEAFIEREHEFKLVAVQPWSLDDAKMPNLAVLCSRWDDASYKQHRCSAEEWKHRYTQYGVDRVWRDDVLPCRVYLRHCVLAAGKLGEPALESFLDHTYLADRQTTVRQHLDAHPDIMTEQPPPALLKRYNG